MVRASRIAYAVLAWAFVIGLVGQVFLIGLGLFADRSAIALHQTLGWLLHFAPMIVLLFAAMARAGRRHWQWALALAVVVFVVPILVTVRSVSPVVAAAHPVAAVIAFALALVVAMHSLRVVRGPLSRTPAAAR